MKGKEAEGKISWRLYEKFKMAKNLKEALELGATMDRIDLMTMPKDTLDSQEGNRRNQGTSSWQMQKKRQT